MESASSLKDTKVAQNNLPVPKWKTWGSVLAIIVGIGGLGIGAAGVAGCFHAGAFSSMAHNTLIAMTSIAGGGGIVLGIGGAVGFIKTRQRSSTEGTDSSTSKGPKKGTVTPESEDETKFGDVNSQSEGGTSKPSGPVRKGSHEVVEGPGDVDSEEVKSLGEKKSPHGDSNKAEELQKEAADIVAGKEDESDSDSDSDSDFDDDGEEYWIEGGNASNQTQIISPRQYTGRRFC